MAHLHILHNRFALVLALLLELWVGEALQQVAPWRSITRKSLTNYNMPCSPVGLSNASRNSFILYGFPPTCACRGAEGPESARSRASVAGERPPSPAKQSTGKRQSSSKLLPHLPTSGLLRGSGLASPHGSQNREPFCREAMLRAPASFSPRAHLRLALRLLASETGQCESTDHP